MTVEQKRDCGDLVDGGEQPRDITYRLRDGSLIERVSTVRGGGEPSIRFRDITTRVDINSDSVQPSEAAASDIDGQAPKI